MKILRKGDLPNSEGNETKLRKNPGKGGNGRGTSFTWAWSPHFEVPLGKIHIPLVKKHNVNAIIPVK